MGCNKKTSIGGQALIEGIMMKGPHKSVIACRLPDGSISVEDYEGQSITKKHKWLSLPIIRGVVNLVESMVFGYKAMMISAERSGMLDDVESEKAESPAQAEPEEITDPENSEPEAEQAPTQDADDEPEVAEVPDEEQADEEPTDEEQPDQEQADQAEKADEQPEETEPADISAEQKADKGTGILMLVVSVISMILGVGLAVVLFMYLPHVLFTKLNALEIIDLTPYQALFEGIVKLIIFLVYMVAVSFMKDIKRVFMYHGAEHKTIFCYENGLELTVENVRKQKRFHPRCGTSFLILMILLSVLVCQLLLFIPGINSIATSDMFGHKIIWVLLKILTLPVVCGLGYELIKICGRHENIITKIISAPGLWLQRISTKEPDDSMIEVAIASIKAVIPENAEDDRW